MPKRIPRRTKLSLVALSGALALSMSAASAAENPVRIIAGPGATIVNYATSRVVYLKGRTLTFTNLDAAPHNVVSKPAGLFSSKLIGLGQSTPVNGVKNLKKGKNYTFVCTLHGAMKGQLLVR